MWPALYKGAAVVPILRRLSDRCGTGVLAAGVSVFFCSGGFVLGVLGLEIKRCES